MPRETAGWTIFAVAMALFVMAWAMTGLAVVDPNAIVTYERLGRLAVAPIPPGLHWGLPTPFGLIRHLGTRNVRSIPIGFLGAWTDIGSPALPASRMHETEGAPRLCGTSTELVVFNALVTYQVRTTAEGIRAFSSATCNPERMLAALAEELISDDAAAKPLDDLLLADRADQSDRLRTRLQDLADAEPLGLDVIFFGVLSVHPPLEVAAAYLDVVNARMDADREARDARIHADGELLRVAMMRDSTIADARAAASVRLTTAQVNADRTAALADLVRQYPKQTLHRIECEELGSFLANRPFVVLDAHLPRAVNIWLDEDHAEPRSNPAPHSRPGGYAP